MPLTLKLAGARGQSERDSRSLSNGTLSVGRAAGNDWVLPDPERQLSKTHCVITAANGRYLLTDLSTNGVFVNGATDRIARNDQVELNDGDEIRFGEYVLSVSIEAAAPAPLIVGHQAPVSGAVRAADPLYTAGDVTPDPLGSDPLDGSFGDPRHAGFVHPITAAPPPARRGSDPFDLAEEERELPLADPARDLLEGGPAGEAWSGPSQADNADAPQHAFIAPKPVAITNFDDLDIDALLGDTPPGQAPVVPAAHAVPLPVAPVRRPAAPVAAVPPAAVAQVPAAPAPPAPVAADAARLLRVFLEAAGVPKLNVEPDPEAVLRGAGQVFREMVDGLRQVLISRAAVKNELRVEQTMLRARDNNALKFAITTEDAVAALLQPDRAGYKPPVEAAREAFEDVRAHEMAVLAGVQTALVGLLKRFEPGALEGRMQPGALGNILPAARKARTWELFCELYKEIAREAEDDFQSVFGREFARAYDAQMRKL